MFHSITARRPASNRRSWVWLPLLAHSRILLATKVRAAVDLAGRWLQTSWRALRMATTVAASNFFIFTPQLRRQLSGSRLRRIEYKRGVLRTDARSGDWPRIRTMRKSKAKLILDLEEVKGDPPHRTVPRRPFGR